MLPASQKSGQSRCRFYATKIFHKLIMPISTNAPKSLPANLRLMALFCAILSMAFFALPPQGAQAETIERQGWKPLGLNAEQKILRQKLQDYLNSLRSFRSRFMQIGDDISITRGILSIKRPGQLRLDYTEPKGSFMVADGSFLHHWDAEMEQSSSIPLEDTLANFILRDQLDLEKNVMITSLSNHSGITEMVLRDSENPETGSLTLVFNASPLILRQWLITDMHGNVTRVFLEQLENDVALDTDLFNFRNPEFLKKRRP